MLPGQRMGHAAAHLPDPNDDNFHEEGNRPSLKEPKPGILEAAWVLAMRQPESTYQPRPKYVFKMAPAGGKYNRRTGIVTNFGGFRSAPAFIYS